MSSTARLPVPSEPLLWLQQVSVLRGPTHPPRGDDALIAADGTLLALGDDAAQQARAAGLTPRVEPDWLLAPTLVDPHSVLEQPLLSRAETLQSLAIAAAQGGYGQVALLPWGERPRDHPEALQLRWDPPQQLHLWGSLSLGDAGLELSPHSELLEAGAIGLASAAELPAPSLLQRSMELGEAARQPLLIAPRQRSLSNAGLVRERIEALRAGWPIDPVASETLPLATLISLQQSHPQQRLVAMNLSTQEAVAALAASSSGLQATVHWWQLLQDSSRLAPTARGWRLEPPLGGPADRRALQQALQTGLISAVAVHHQALDAEEQLLPIDQRRVGLAGHGLVLPLLWHALVEAGGWSIQQLWQGLCWGPCAVLGLPPELLNAGSHRWLLYDPGAHWTWSAASRGSLAANQPLADGTAINGLVRATGLLPQASWQLS